jgi:DNA-binding CsgD family transcriptional regulator
VAVSGTGHGGLVSATMSRMGDLGVLGLTEEQEWVYEAVGTSATGLPHDVAVATGLTDDTVQAHLVNLLRIGLLHANPAVDGSYVLAPIEPAVDALVHAQQEQLARAQLYGRVLAQRLARQAEASRPDQLVSVVVGAEAIEHLFAQLQVGAKTEILTLDRPPYVTPYAAQGTGVNEEMRGRLAAGVRCRTIYDQAVLEHPGPVERIASELAAGEDGRTLPGLPLKMCVADRELAFLPLIDAGSDGQPAALLVRQSVLVDSCVALFEALWRMAMPLRPGFVSAEGVAEEEREMRQIVGLLAAGYTDARIAAHLEVSERTIRRKIAATLDVLGAQSRFQAGIKAHERHWV